MRTTDVLIDAFGRVRDIVHLVVEDLTPAELTFQVDGRANSIGWLVWHLTRVQDDHVADVADIEQVWTARGWTERFALPYQPGATGYGHLSNDVDAFHVQAGEQLLGYHDAVYEQTVLYVNGLVEEDLDRVVDPSWNPPVTLGVRLVSVVADDLQHAGQAAFVRGLLRHG